MPAAFARAAVGCRPSARRDVPAVARRSGAWRSTGPCSSSTACSVPSLRWCSTSGSGAARGSSTWPRYVHTNASSVWRCTRPGWRKCWRPSTNDGWRHVRVVEGDVLDFLPRLAPASLAGVRIWFPDPWLKRKQQHRRLVRPDVVAALTDRLSIGGTLHVATDIAEYARHAESVVAAEPRLRGGVVPRPEWRPLTRFERRGHRRRSHPDRPRVRENLLRCPPPVTACSPLGDG